MWYSTTVLIYSLPGLHNPECCLTLVSDWPTISPDNLFHRQLHRNTIKVVLLMLNQLNTFPTVEIQIYHLLLKIYPGQDYRTAYLPFNLHCPSREKRLLQRACPVLLTLSCVEAIIHLLYNLHECTFKFMIRSNCPECYNEFLGSYFFNLRKYLFRTFPGNHIWKYKSNCTIFVNMNLAFLFAACASSLVDSFPYKKICLWSLIKSDRVSW